MEEQKRRRGGIVGPLILITLGLVFLLNNLDVLDWSIWEVIWRLWPVLLIAAGLDLLIGRRSALGTLLTLLLVVALLAGGLWLLGTDIGFDRATVVHEIRQARGEATQAEVVVNPGAGRLHVEALPESANLVEGTIHLGKGEAMKPDLAVKGSKATFTLRSDRQSFGPTLGGWYGEDRLWDLGIAPEVTLELKVGLSAGESDLDLTDLTLSNLDVDMGVGKTTVTLPDEGDFAAKVDGAIGEIIVIIPEGLEARVRASTAIGSSQLPEDYQRQDDVYTSPGYARADNRVDLNVDLAIGNITVRHTE